MVGNILYVIVGNKKTEKGEQDNKFKRFRL